MQNAAPHIDLEQCSVMQTVTPKVLVLYMVGSSLFMRGEERYLHCATFCFSFLSIAIIKYPDDFKGGGIYLEPRLQSPGVG